MSTVTLVFRFCMAKSTLDEWRAFKFAIIVVGATSKMVEDCVTLTIDVLGSENVSISSFLTCLWGVLCSAL